MRPIVLVAILVTGGCVGWTKANTALEVAFVTAQAVDYNQTSKAVEWCGEANAIIGHCGQNVSPAGYFLTTTLIHIAVAAALPRWWRESFQSTTLTIEGKTVYTNIRGVEIGESAHCVERLGTKDQCVFPGF